MPRRATIALCGSPSWKRERSSVGPGVRFPTDPIVGDVDRLAGGRTKVNPTTRTASASREVARAIRRP